MNTYYVALARELSGYCLRAEAAEYLSHHKR